MYYELTGCCPNPLAIPSRMMLPFLKYLVGGRRPFHGLSVGETAGPAMAGQCGGGKNPPQISRRKDQAGSLGTKEKAESSLALMNISHLRCGPVGVRFIEPAMTGVINATPTRT